MFTNTKLCFMMVILDFVLNGIDCSVWLRSKNCNNFTTTTVYNFFLQGECTYKFYCFFFFVLCLHSCLAKSMSSVHRRNWRQVQLLLNNREREGERIYEKRIKGQTRNFSKGKLEIYLFFNHLETDLNQVI